MVELGCDLGEFGVRVVLAELDECVDIRLRRRQENLLDATLPAIPPNDADGLESAGLRRVRCDVARARERKQALPKPDRVEAAKVAWMAVAPFVAHGQPCMQDTFAFGSPDFENRPAIQPEMPDDLPHLVWREPPVAKPLFPKQPQQHGSCRKRDLQRVEYAAAPTPIVREAAGTEVGLLASRWVEVGLVALGSAVHCCPNATRTPFAG